MFLKMFLMREREGLLLRNSMEKTKWKKWTRFREKAERSCVQLFYA